MTRILVIGFDPESVDFSDPGSPPGLDPAKIWEGVRRSLERIAEHGWEGTQCMVKPDETAVATVEQALANMSYACVVIGGGVRLAHNSVPILEAIVDAVRRLAPATPIAFNEGPEKSLEAAQRWVRGA
ncbi:hypothetical protein [Sphingomonas abietis]|uniref:Uncharacterized protein n=1 Tax=Sphingomonas abietis TaxID=3012344 RepID=A0ABY7NHP7_9SPHN|nr:hypothetical protein [Sphingomonas abietis]WBO21054.1 hypothetical protein PBT88_12655 [Sphingomonas abietis]